MTSPRGASNGVPERLDRFEINISKAARHFFTPALSIQEYIAGVDFLIGLAVVAIAAEQRESSREDVEQTVVDRVRKACDALFR